jgi:alpha-1,2-mannosyltransferase
VNAFVRWLWWRPARIVGLVGMALGLAMTFVDGVPLDLQVYRAGGATVLSDPASLYRGPGDQLPFTYPPLAAVLFAPLSLLPGPAAASLLTAVSLLCLLRTTQLIMRRLPGLARWNTDLRLVAIVLGALLLEPVWRTRSFGQINLVLMWLVVEAVLGPKSRSGGWIVGVVAGVKLTPAVFGLYYLARWDWRSNRQVVLGFAATIALGFLVLPTAASQFWSETVMDAERVGAVAYTMNQSVNGALWRALGPGGSSMAWLLIAAVLLGLAWATIRGFERAGYPAHGLIACAVFGLLVSPISWSHHWVWVVPVLLVLADAALGSDRQPAAAGLAVAWLAATASAVLWRLPAGEGVEYAVPIAVKTLSDVYVLLGVLTLLWLWLVSRRCSTVDVRGAGTGERPPDPTAGPAGTTPVVRP